MKDAEFLCAFSAAYDSVRNKGQRYPITKNKHINGGFKALRQVYYGASFCRDVGLDKGSVTTVRECA